MIDMSGGGDPQKILFIISPIGSEKSTTRGHFDKARRHIIDPVAKDMGYRTIRSDEIPRPGTITNHIIEHLLKDDLVVADMTERNPNVFYELAVRRAVRKPVILMGAIGDRVPFDLAAQRVIFYDLDPDNITKAKEELRRQISEVNSEKFIVDSPIETAISFESTGQVTEESQMQEVLSILRNLSERMSRVENGRTLISGVAIPSSPSIGPAIVLSKTVVSPGEYFTISGIGFTSSTIIRIFLDERKLIGVPSNPDGSIVATVIIPNDTALGTHNISLIDDLANVELVTQLVVK
ncbi:unnamed protein product [marine sediment metagenome]|uniref:IPT/TIG domain-containing protein n=1 Tax=marine sediment metagenome TaxID=412755 RepID=X0T252_9ZZZZ